MESINFELLSISNLSLLLGVESPEEIVELASRYGFRGLGINDYNSFLGSLRGCIYAEKLGLEVFLSLRFSYKNTLDLVVFPLNLGAYQRVCSYLSNNVSIFNIPDSLDAVAVLKIREAPPEELLEYIIQHFCLVKIAYFPFYGNLDLIESISLRYDLGVICTLDPAFVDDESRMVADCLAATRLKKRLSDLSFLERNQNFGDFVKPKNYSNFFSKRMIEETNNLGELLPKKLFKKINQKFPESKVYHSTDLRAICESKLSEKSLNKTKYIRLLEKELKIVTTLGYERFFLICYEIVNFAKKQGILYQGRGAAANSIICYLLDITPVHPDEFDFLFERFVNTARNEPPDIDIDFENEKRQCIFDYVFSNYKSHSALISSLITYQPRSAFRDVGRALGIPLSIINKITKLTHEWINNISSVDALKDFSGLDKNICNLWLKLSQRFLSIPRHFSQHVGGVMFHENDISDIAPTYLSKDGTRRMIYLTNYEIDSLKFVKVDILGLGMLTAIKQTLNLLKESGLNLSPSSLKADDTKVYNLISSGNTIGIFQVESRAQQAMVTKLKPNNFYDLVIEVAIVRPGPIHGDMVHPYLRRRMGIEEVNFPDETVKKILGKTLGVPLFQEQALRLAKDLAKLNDYELEDFRRALKNYKPDSRSFEYYTGLIKKRLIEAGYSLDFAEKCMNHIKGFSLYGFPESHAAAFAKLVYFSAFLKTYFAPYFYAGLLNSQPMGFYNPRQLITDARKNGVKVISQDINLSYIDTIVKDGAIILGFNLIKNVKYNSLEKIIENRKYKKYENFKDFIDRSESDIQTTINLIKGGCFDSLCTNRRALIFQALTGLYEKDHLSFSKMDRYFYDSIIREFSSDGNYISLYLEKSGVKALSYSSLMKVKPKVGSKVCVAGLASIKQKPVTAKGFAFICLEDDFGFINLVIPPSCFEKYSKVILNGEYLVAEGIIQNYLGDFLPYVKVEKLEEI